MLYPYELEQNLEKKFLFKVHIKDTNIAKVEDSTYHLQKICTEVEIDQMIENFIFRTILK